MGLAKMSVGPTQRLLQRARDWAGDAEELAEAWLIATRVRNATVLATGKPADQVPQDTTVLGIVAHLMGYQPGDSQRLLEDYRRRTRRARNVMERVFYAN